MSPIFLEKHKVGILEYITGGEKKKEKKERGEKTNHNPKLPRNRIRKGLLK